VKDTTTKNIKTKVRFGWLVTTKNIKTKVRFGWLVTTKNIKTKVRFGWLVKPYDAWHGNRTDVQTRILTATEQKCIGRTEEHSRQPVKNTDNMVSGLH